MLKESLRVLPQQQTFLLPLEKPVFIERFNYTSNQGLRISLAGQDFILPIVNVGSDEKPMGIAYFDPNSDENLAEAAAQELGRLFTELEGDVFIGVSSSKSEGIFQKAVEIASSARGIDPQYMILHRGPFSEFADISFEGGLIKPICPITGQDRDKADKYIAMNKEQRQALREWVRMGKRIVGGDDVISTGQTIGGMQAVINDALEYEIDLPFAAVIEEIPMIYNHPDQPSRWKPQLPENHFPAIITPVILG